MRANDFRKNLTPAVGQSGYAGEIEPATPPLPVESKLNSITARPIHEQELPEIKSAPPMQHPMKRTKLRQLANPDTQRTQSPPLHHYPLNQS